MKKLFLSLLISLLLIAVASPALGAYVLPDPGGRDGFLIDTATGNIITMRAGVVVQTLSTAGALTVTDLAVTDDLTVADDAAITGLMTVGETLGVTGDATFGGGAGAITAVAAGSSLVCLDDSATGFVAGSSTNPNMLQFVTTIGGEKIVVEGTTSAVALHVDVGTLLVDESAAITGLATVGGTLGVTDDATLGGGAGGLTMTAAGSSLVCLDNSATGWVAGSSGNPNMLQLVTSTGTEKVVVEGTTSQVALHVDIGTLLVDESAAITGLATVGGTLGVTDDATLGGGAGGLTMTAAGSSLLCLNNSSTGWVAGSSDNPNMFQLDTQTGTEKVIVEGTTSQVALHVDVGTLLVDESAEITGDAVLSAGLTAVSPAILFHEIRFCGNGFNGADDHFMGPEPYDDTEADLVTGGAGCDGLDANTAAGADELPPVGQDMIYKPVSMVCSGKCTGASAANDQVTFALYDDTAAVTGMTCQTSAFTGDATRVQCNITDTTPATVAAGSLLAVQMVGSDDVCNDAGDDFECFVYVTF